VPVLDVGVARTGGVTALGGGAGMAAPDCEAGALGVPTLVVLPEVPLFGAVVLGGVYFGVVTQGVALGAVAVAGLAGAVTLGVIAVPEGVAVPEAGEATLDAVDVVVPAGLAGVLVEAVVDGVGVVLTPGVVFAGQGIALEIVVGVV